MKPEQEKPEEALAAAVEILGQALDSLQNLFHRLESQLHATLKEREQLADAPSTGLPSGNREPH